MYKKQDRFIDLSFGMQLLDRCWNITSELLATRDVAAIVTL